MELRGVVKQIIFNNAENGYTVALIDSDDGEITAVGNAFMPAVYENVLLEGDIVYHPRFGEQFAFTSWTAESPGSKSSIVAYLSSGLLPHIGVVMANRIYDAFGDETLNILQNTPERFMEIEGIGKKKLKAISDAFFAQREYRDVHMKLIDLDISTNMIYKIYQRFGASAYNIVIKNPYVLFEEISGIGFDFSDRLARRLGVEENSEIRINAAMRYVMLASVGRGNCYLPKNIFIKSTCDVLGLGEEEIKRVYDNLIFSDVIYVEKRADEDRVYLSSMSRAEIYCSRKLYELSRTDYDVDSDNISKYITDSEVKLDIAFGDDQKLAIANSLNSGLTVITGGPGTGKTTILRAILDIAENLELSVMLAAPTGRAAKRMSEATGCTAKTIHRLLEYNHSEEELVFNKDESDPLECDLLIIDEASMIDLMLMNSLLHAVKYGTRVILIGDVDQLPSVGAGNVLNDIIDSGVCDCFRLKLIYRQADASRIVLNAHMINNGEFPVLNEEKGDFFFIRKSSPSAVADTIVDLVSERLPKFYGFDPLNDIQILSPMKKGDAGVTRLNELLQAKLNPKSGDSCEIKRGMVIFREKDRIMQTKNDYDIEYKLVGDSVFEQQGTGIFNGDLGYVKSVNEDDVSMNIVVDEEKIYEISREGMDNISLSYAMTVHKSQGSEFPVVVMPIVFAPPMLATRNLIYTAITRAKKLVVLVGSERYLDMMIKNNEGEMRYSGLNERIKSVISTMGE